MSRATNVSILKWWILFSFIFGLQWIAEIMLWFSSFISGGNVDLDSAFKRYKFKIPSSFQKLPEKTKKWTRNGNLYAKSVLAFGVTISSYFYNIR